MIEPDGLNKKNKYNVERARTISGYDICPAFLVVQMVVVGIVGLKVRYFLLFPATSPTTASLFLTLFLSGGS